MSYTSHRNISNQILPFLLRLLKVLQRARYRAKANGVLDGALLSLFVMNSSRPSLVDFDHGYCTLGVRGVATRAASSAAGTDVGVAVCCTKCRCSWSWGVFLSVCLPPCSPLFCQVQDLLLTCLHQFLEQAAPADAVCCSVHPDLCFDTQIFHVALADILISQLGANLGSFSGRKFTIENVLWDSAIFHTAHVARPAQSALSEQHIRGGEAGMGKNLGVRHFVAPADAKDAAKTSHVENAQLLLLLGIGSPGFSPVQEGADYVGIVHCNLGWSGWLGVLPEASGQSS